MLNVERTIDDTDRLATVNSLRNSLFGIVCFLVLFMVGCDLPQEPGPMPTEIIETEFEPGLNVFGVLRSDGLAGSSFIRVEKAFDPVNEAFYETYSAEVRDADVSVADSSQTYDFHFSEDTLRGNLFFNPGFVPIPGESYSLKVTADGFPNLTGSTTIPQKPQTENRSITAGAFEFDLLMTEDTGMYEVYLFLSDGTMLNQRVINDGEARKVVTLKMPSAGSPLFLNVYGYDHNLTEYISAAVTLRLNSYQKTVATVEGGYGAFGSVSATSVWLGQ